MIHSELSEALEEARAGRPMVWHNCTEGCERVNNPCNPCNPTDKSDCLNYGKEMKCTWRDAKPEGIAVELIDCAIRIMDFMGYYEIEYEAKSKRLPYTTPEEPLPILVCKLHAVLSSVFEEPFDPSDCSAIGIETGIIHYPHRIGMCFSDAIDMIFDWIRAHGVSPGSVLKEKADYNKSRPYRHGKKF